MGNLRTKLSRAGFSEVAVNFGKRSKTNPDKQPTHANIKRPKRAEVNFLPNFPRGEDLGSLAKIRLHIVDEIKMTDKNLPRIASLTQMTFALWRKEVISDELPVGEILERWPALTMESQVKIVLVHTDLILFLSSITF